MQLSFKSLKVGFVGILTGMRNHNADGDAFSISINYRKVGRGWLSTLFHLYLQSCWPLSYLIRHVLDVAESYSEAVAIMSTTMLIAPCYVCLAGSRKQQGMIITRDRDGEARGPQRLSEQTPFVVQTNIDGWIQQVDSVWADGDSLLLNAIERRTVACSLASARTETGFSFDDAFALLNHSPVRNELTIYSSIMHPRSGTHTSKIHP